MSRIAFLGLGAMGSRMARRLIGAGHQLTVWNRSAQAAAPLVAAGAQLASSPAQAAAGAEFVIAMLRDDAASRAVWCDPSYGAFAAMQPGSIAIESSTLSIEWIRELARHANERKVSLLEAPVSGSLGAAESGQLVYLLGGEETALRRAEPVLSQMGAAIHHLGPIGAGTLAKLATNALLGIQVTALAEIISLLKQHDVQVEKILGAISATSVWAPVASYLSASMLREDFTPQFPVSLIEKDFGYVLRAAGAEAAAPTLAAVRTVFSTGTAQGLGAENMTAVLKLLPTRTNA